MIVEYTIYLKERDNVLKRMSLSVCAFNVNDILESALDLMIEYTDSEYICYKINLGSIVSFT